MPYNTQASFLPPQNLPNNYCGNIIHIILLPCLGASEARKTLFKLSSFLSMFSCLAAPSREGTAPTEGEQHMMDESMIQLGTVQLLKATTVIMIAHTILVVPGLA